MAQGSEGDDVVTETWTVYLEAGAEVTDDEVKRIGDLLEEEAPGAVMAPAPVLGCRFVLDDEPLPSRALVAAQSLFVTAVRKALRTRRVAEEWDDVTITRAELALGADPGWVPRGLITHRGLAARCGFSETYVRRLMHYKGAPEPVAVEGGDRAAIYDTESAVRHLERIRAKA
jgi:hypothetical protein